MFLFCLSFGCAGGVFHSSPAHSCRICVLGVDSAVLGCLSVRLPDDQLTGLQLASNNCFFLTHKWCFTHSSLFCLVWTDLCRYELTAGGEPSPPTLPTPSSSPIGSQEGRVLWPMESLLMSTYRSNCGRASPIGWMEPHSAAVIGWNSLVCCDLLALSSLGGLWLAE